ncbi:MAG: hypothetical protein ABIP77_06930, partial [Candidatus Limnocylindrales bacterium]
MNEPIDRVIADWLDEGPDSGPSDGLDRALAATRRVGQRPGWTLPERWLPTQQTMGRAPHRPIVAFVMLAMLIVALVATTLFVGSQRRELPTSLFRNGAVVYERDGDLFIADQLGGTPRALVAGPETDSDPVFSPQGDRIAFVREATRASVMTVRTDGTDARVLAQIRSAVGLNLEWAPDGGAILASSDGRFGTSMNGVILIQSDGSRSRPIEAGVDGGSSSAAWRPDGRHIALLAEDKATMVALISDADGTNIRRLPIDGMKINSALAWSPDGTRLALSGVLTSTITLVDIDADGNVIASHELSIDSEMGVVTRRSWSPDGRQLAVKLFSGRVGIISSDGSG